MKHNIPTAIETLGRNGIPVTQEGILVRRRFIRVDLYRQAKVKSNGENSGPGQKLWGTIDFLQGKGYILVT